MSYERDNIIQIGERNISTNPSRIVTTSLADFEQRAKVIGSGKLVGELVEMQIEEGYQSFIAITLASGSGKSLLYQEPIRDTDTPYSLVAPIEDKRLLQDYYTLIDRIREIAHATELPSREFPERSGEWRINGLRAMQFGDAEGTLYSPQALDATADSDVFVDFYSLRRTMRAHGISALPTP